MADEPTTHDDGLIPIATIEPEVTESEGPFVPRELVDDPDTGDGSTGRAGVPISKWRLHKLETNRLGSITDPSGRDRRSRNARRTRNASRKARSAHGRKTRSRTRAIVATIVVLLICAVIGFSATYALEMWGGKTIPNVIGLMQGVATEQLEDRGFTVDTEQVESDILEGHVVSISPEAGQRIDTSEHVLLGISTSRKIPTVVGKSRTEACDALRAAGVTSIRYELRTEDGKGDTVLEVRPSEGSVFMSTDTITLVVSQLPDMPNVLGKDRATAALDLDWDGIPINWDFERSDANNRLLVVRTDPAAGEAIYEDGVTVYLGDPLVEVARLADYFDSTILHAVEFLQEEGYDPKQGMRMDDGHAAASFGNDQGMLIAFLPDPWSHDIERVDRAFEHVVSSSMAIEGVRLRVPAQQLNWSTTPDEATARMVIDLCGFSEISAACTQDDIILPGNAERPDSAFYCCYGEMGDYIWTVLLRGVGQPADGADPMAITELEAVATCAPKASYDAIDLSGFGERVCDYVAYQDEVLG